MNIKDKGLSPEGAQAEHASYIEELYQGMVADADVRDEKRSELIDIRDSSVAYPGKTLTQAQFYSFQSPGGVRPALVMHFQDHEDPTSYRAFLISLPDSNDKLRYWYNYTDFNLIDGKIANAKITTDGEKLRTEVLGILKESAIVSREETKFHISHILEMLERVLHATSNTIYSEIDDSVRDQINQLLATPWDRYRDARGAYSQYMGVCGITRKLIEKSDSSGAFNPRVGIVSEYTVRQYRAEAMEFLRKASPLALTYVEFGNPNKDTEHWLSLEGLAEPILPLITEGSRYYDKGIHDEYLLVCEDILAIRGEV